MAREIGPFTRKILVLVGKMQLGHLPSHLADGVNCDDDTNVQSFLSWQAIAFPALSIKQPRRRRSPTRIEWELRHPYWLIDLNMVLSTIGVSVRQPHAIRGIPVVVASSKILATVHKLQLMCQTLCPPYRALNQKNLHAWDITYPCGTQSCFFKS
jgi:hypothetical protein